MKLLGYLRSCLPTIALVVAAVALSAFILAVSGAGLAVIVLVSIISCLGLALALAADWVRKRPFYDDLVSCADDAQRPLWLSEVVERPDYLEGAITYDALSAISKAANDGVNAYRRQASEYREYIETWVHEAKSPLAAAHLMLDNLRAEADRVESVDKLRALDDELCRVEGFIEQALFYARSETVDRDYLIRKYRLGDLVAASVKANAATLIGVHMAPVMHDLDFEVFTDEKWIEFIFGQVIQNAAKYARRDNPRLEFSGVLRDRGNASERVELTVRDNGCGVSAADLPRVFDKGFTGENGRSGKRSTGIGLYLVKRLCDKMGVGILADSVEDEGFAITFSFSTNKFQYVDRGGSPLAPPTPEMRSFQ